MDQSIINHLFLPHYLPSSADDDFLIQNNHQNEYKLLEYMNKYLISLKFDNATSTLSTFHILSDCIKRWSFLQNPKNISVHNLQTAIEQLPPRCFLPICFHAQNAAILIEIDENNIHQPLISSWQVSLPTDKITSSLTPHLSCFPVKTYKLNNRSQLSSKVHCELLMDFMTNTIEYPKSYKASRQVAEIRDVPESHYVCQWWIQQFQEINIEDNPGTFVQFKKKHRDQIRWNNALLPFRRSDLWMTMKVIFQIILTKHLGNIGTVVYKLLMTHFLTYTLYTQKLSTDFQISNDVLVHCTRKIVRRLNKIETKWSSIDFSGINEWYQEIKQKINQLLSESDWQKIIRIDEIKNQTVLTNSSELDPNETYQHSCSELRKYLNGIDSSKVCEFSLNAQKYDSGAHVNQMDYIPSIEELMGTFNYTVSVALTHMEIWVEVNLEQWLNRSSLHIGNRFEALSSFYEKYQSTALNHYYFNQGLHDPVGYSRFIITSLTIIQVMHENLCNDPRFKRLKDHSIDIPNLKMLFEFLALPIREDMIRARKLYDYFCQFNTKLYSDLLTDIKSTNAFGVHFANQKQTMKDSIEQIRAQAVRDRQQKIEEVNDAKRRYRELMDSIRYSSCSCEYKYGYLWSTCNTCKVRKSAEGIEVKIFECPIPSTAEGASAVIFELQMPIEIRRYRDILWQFINRPNPNPHHDMYEWLSATPHASKLGPYHTGPSNRKIKLVSSTKSATQTHYSYPPSIASTPVEGFLFENSLKVQISPTKAIEFDNERRTLTPQLVHSDYKQLQFTVDTTNFVQNQVIAKLSACSLRMKSTQFVEFGSFRSGHRLQWWNLLTILEMDSLPIAEESVAILIIHSILQYGPFDSEILSDHWCSESHRQILEDHFVDELISRLNHHLDNCQLNWQNEFVLLAITIITMRILTICQSTREERAVNLAIKCRRIGEEWMDLISKSLQTISPSAFNEIKDLRLKMVHIGISCLSTFSIDQDRIHNLLASNEHLISLLKAATTIHDNLILNKDQSSLSFFMRNLMRLSERVLVRVQPIITAYLYRTSYQCLNEFTSIYWAVIKSEGDMIGQRKKRRIEMNGQWKKRKVDIYDGWYDCQYQSRQTSLDCIQGIFLIDNMTIGFLPVKITSNELFLRLFGDHIFEVQAGMLPNTYITKYSYHDDGRVNYEFCFNDQNKYLIITERHKQTKETFQLMPHSCFQTELPDTFISNHSHWWNAERQIVEFRSVHFQELNFLDNKPYVLSITTGYITTTEINNIQTLVNQSSVFFKNLFSRYFDRLDKMPYVYMMRDTPTVIHIHLSRLKIAFRYNVVNNTITSREYSDMCIDENQWLGTLTGFKSGLVLSPLPVNGQRLEKYPYRKLIVPFGQIHAARSSDTSHQCVTIQRSSSVHQYFVFIINDRLKILQSTDSPTGWLYLALLHAMTSHPSPDQYTGMTGMERAIQLLNSAGCWSDQPYDELSLNILGQIAAISPRVDYYPKYLTCMVKIDWNNNGLFHSLQHYGYYLIAKKLIENSQQLNFMYPSSTSGKVPEIFNGKLQNTELLKKLYWNYRDSYNPIARLSPEMEDEILSRLKDRPYQLAPEYDWHATNYNTIRLVDDLYGKGDVHLRDCSKQHWLPLSQWFSSENELDTMWVGLLKLADRFKTEAAGKRTDDIERFENLLNFLHYISVKQQIKPFYLQMLKTVIKVPYISMRSITFPRFIQYRSIEETSVIEEELDFETDLTKRQRRKAIAEIEECLEMDCDYEDDEDLIDSDTDDISDINLLLKKWRSNKNLRSFLETVQTRICSVGIERFHDKVRYYPQQFVVESINDHHQIRINMTKKLIDQTLLQNAEQKFNHLYSGHFDKPTVRHQTTNRQNQFPNEIFTSISKADNPTSKIGHYFKNQLDQSWKQLLLDKQIQKEDPSINEINHYLNSLRKESSDGWNALVNSITNSNEELFQAGLVLRITPTTLISLVQQQVVKLQLTLNQRTLLGGILVNWTLEQQLERALHFAIHDKWEDFKKEISNTPHANWKPADYIPWLILELEMNITIRENQIRVAHHMMEPNTTLDDATVRSIVMQMNMGEGKTSVILPMLAVSLCSSSSSLVRIIVLKSLFPTNYQSLRYKLGGILNRRIFPFACRRDMNFTYTQVNQIYARLKRASRDCDVILISPEDILSFDLLTIDKCRRHEFDTGRSMLSMQRWLKTCVRDVLDESDEILHVKYQLIYTVGGQQQVDAGAERWKTIQSILELVRKHAASIYERFSEEVCYKSAERCSAFPQFRLQSHEPFTQLCEIIAQDWIQTRSYRLIDREMILSFILKSNSSVEQIINQFSQNDVKIFLIIRGLLSSEVLLVALKKRYRVNYGVNPSQVFNRLLAVPFRAKDVVADRTEFGHPDVALVLTHFCYYYSGLNDSQLIQCFDRLSDEETDSASIYDQWIAYQNAEDIPKSIQQWKGVNLKDYRQRTEYLFPTFRCHMLVINYFLNHFVFPREAKQFPYKLVSSAWDLSSSSARSKIITGFSGTNDTQLLLPVHIRQYDLPELQKIDAIVVNNLLQPENERYQSLPINASSDQILKEIVAYQDRINVILDVGALFIDGTNKDIAVKWLNLSDRTQIDYAIYFQSDSIVVCDRQYHHHRFETSPASERLDRCIFYLDEIHTRGTDFKFPRGFRAAVTLGNGLTKDRFVQACMRMRKLGNGHSLTFWSSHEVHQQITGSTKDASISLIDILRWLYENTVQSTWDGLHHWAAQSLSFQRKIAAFRNIHWNEQQQEFTDAMMAELARECLEPEIIELVRMYGAPKALQTVFEIHSTRHKNVDYHLSNDIRDMVLKKLHDYGGTKQRLSQLLDEEQQRELEQELEEERQLARPPPVTPCEPILYEEIKRLSDIRHDIMDLAQYPSVFRPLPYAFTDTTFYAVCQPHSWQQSLWASTEFQRVILTKGESLNSFLRPPRWIIVYRNQHIIFVSAFEANELIGRLQSNKSSITTLRILLPRIKRIQSIFVNTPTLTVPRSTTPLTKTGTYFIPIEWLVQLFIFNGTLYFETVDEQTAYCQCLSLCPKPRSTREEKAFEDGWIAADGFVGDLKHRRPLRIDQAHFNANPLALVKQLIENRNQSHAPIASHIGSIIFNTFKLLS